jgi:hypothetical protein
VNSLVQFLTTVFTEGVFHEEHTAEELLEKLKARPDCSEDTITFLNHAAKTGLLNLNVCELLSGKRSEVKRAAFGLDYLQAKCLAWPVENRVAQVIKEAKWWDHQRTQAGYAVA